MINNPSLYDWSEYTILIVEDDVSSTFYLKEVLRDTGVDIFHVPDGKKAVDICAENPSIDLVLMDIKMPVMDGYEATLQIKAIRPELPVIAETADATYNHHKLCMEAGCSDFIAKPIDSMELLEKISNFLK